MQSVFLDSVLLKIRAVTDWQCIVKCHEQEKASKDSKDNEPGIYFALIALICYSGAFGSSNH